MKTENHVQLETSQPEDEVSIRAAGKEVIIRKYGLLKPTNWGADCEQELDKMDLLFNKLVDIDIEYRDKYKEKVGSSQRLDDLRLELQSLVARKTSLVAGIKGQASAAMRKSRASESRSEIRQINLQAGIIKKSIAVAY